MRWRFPALVGILAAGSLLAGIACSSFGTDGGASPSAEAGTPDGAAADGSGVTADAAPPSLSCDTPLLRIGIGGVPFSKFDVHDVDAGLQFSNESVHATAMLAVDQTAKGYVSQDFPTSVSHLVLDHDMAIHSDPNYVELGCVLTLSATTGVQNPSTSFYFVAQPTSPHFAFEVDDGKADGGITTALSSDLGDVPTNAIHVHLELDTSAVPGHIVGAFATSGMTTPRAIDVPSSGTTSHVTVSCGLYFARGRGPGGPVDVTVANVGLAICP